MTFKSVPSQVSDYRMPLHKESGVSLWWLGQAGFLIRSAKATILIDPYLSDALAVKYKGKEFPHIRMMPSPLPMAELKDIDFFFSSHAHSDHMDPGLIPLLAETSPNCIFHAPEAVKATALERGIPENRFVGLDAGDSLTPLEGFTVDVLPAAHESLQKDKAGRHLFLGYIFSFAEGGVIYHPGDTLLYEGLEKDLSPFDISLALLPVNGRREELSSKGIAGNFNFEEARRLMESQDIPFMIPHHYGMFDFNTVDTEALAENIRSLELDKKIFPARIGMRYHLRDESHG